MQVGIWDAFGGIDKTKTSFWLAIYSIYHYQSPLQVSTCSKMSCCRWRAQTSVRNFLTNASETRVERASTGCHGTNSKTLPAICQTNKLRGFNASCS